MHSYDLRARTYSDSLMSACHLVPVSYHSVTDCMHRKEQKLDGEGLLRYVANLENV